MVTKHRRGPTGRSQT